MQTLTKRQMLERVQFSKNLQTAIRASQILENKLSENEVKGMFFDAILRDDFKDALMRADDNNRKALEAKNFTVARMCFIKPDTLGYESGAVYYIKLEFNNGYICVTPTATSNAEEIIYPSMTHFLQEWSSHIY